jgi:hypothetical protein
MVDATERLQVLRSQEEMIYKTSDYLARMQQQAQKQQVQMDMDRPAAAGNTPLLESTMEEQEASSSSSSPKKRKSWDKDGNEEPSMTGRSEQLRSNDVDSATTNSSTDGSSSTQINKHWREKICEWAYQGTLQQHINCCFCCLDPFLYYVCLYIIV